MTTSRRVPILASVLVFVTGTASGQVRGTLDAGSGTLRVASQSPSSIILFAPSLRLRSSTLQLDADANYAGLSEGGWQTGGLVNTGFFQRWGSLKAQAGVIGGWSRVAWGRAAGGWLGTARLEIANEQQGVDLRAGAGNTLTTDGAQALSMVEAGSWRRLGSLNLGFRLRRTGLTVVGQDQTLDDGNTAPPFSDTLPAPQSTGRRLLQDHYTDTDATASWHRGDVDFEGGVGRRFGKPAARYTSWFLKGLYWISPRLGLVASVGRFPTDVITGMPSGSFATLSMRINLRGQERVSRESLRHHEAVAEFKVSPAAPGRYVLSVHAPGTAMVEIMGSFSQWQPMALEQQRGGWWNAQIALEAGTHEINVRFDHGPWQVPAGLRVADDDFGGNVGVFVID
ncbi:MAG: glycogen-binding domain-containing protein [Gemmatimonadota bacterium]